MTYVLNDDDLNTAINNLYYAKGVIAGLSSLNPLSISQEPKLQDVINLLKNIRDYEKVDFMKEGE